MVDCFTRRPLSLDLPYIHLFRQKFSEKNFYGVLLHPRRHVFYVVFIADQFFILCQYQQNEK